MDRLKVTVIILAFVTLMGILFWLQVQVNRAHDRYLIDETKKEIKYEGHDCGTDIPTYKVDGTFLGCLKV